MASKSITSTARKDASEILRAKRDTRQTVEEIIEQLLSVKGANDKQVMCHVSRFINDLLARRIMPWFLHSTVTYRLSSIYITFLFTNTYVP